MNIHIMGESHAAQHFKLAAQIRGFQLTSQLDEAELILVSEDTPTDENGVRDLRPIRAFLETALAYSVPVILTSQVPPGFCRSYDNPKLFHQSETLRIKDALIRAVFPEQIIMGRRGEFAPGWPKALNWAESFDCPVVWCSYETAEFSKIAINMTLASQVENTNRLKAAGDKVNAFWPQIAAILGYDKRIGRHSYLTPGRWQDSKHLLRDAVTLKEIENG